MKKIDLFFSQLDNALESKKGLSMFSADGVDFLYDHYNELENEAPSTNDYLQTSNFIDDLDGYEYGLCTPKHFEVVKKNREKALSIYRKELNNQ